ncbi:MULTISPECIES: dTDP-glucose 4,6-dehydratase [unclassified Streptomyces]|uniref:dTDP-glucose 4,6-dehydratase n=1 Tax=unclassified Streptomyces TaxID=2593676 RepID=UPI000CD5A688|nr:MULTISPECIES: dTDP-glucose 4,6-dehydratase [unclassified Streptomyces]AWL41303.1 dTDP-glucose 4,6-dehydratase [Streptomyces sp. SM18]
MTPPTNILVTGGAGFIGSHYVRTLLGPPMLPESRDDVRITVLDKLTYAGNPANLDSVRDSGRFAFVHGDICDTGLVDELVAAHDQVVHFAAESHVDRSIVGGGEFVRTNVVGTQTLLDAALCHGIETFVHVSTDEVYGSADAGSWTEREPLRPSSPYSATKASSDLIALAHHRTHGLDVRVTRCSNNYGHHQFPEKLIPLFITNLMSGRKVPLYGDGRNVRDWLHIDDHVQGIELVRTQGCPGEVYNIGGGTELSNRELTERLLDECGAGPDSVEHVADRKGHDHRYSVDCTKIRAQLGYAPRRDFAEALAETVRWYHDNRAWWESFRV